MSSGLPGRVRIVAGERRGHQLKVRAGGKVRPTGERVREAMFNVLGPLDGSTVLDLFAGTGALGLEALSRGATTCVFVEEDPAVAAVLRENVVALRYSPVSDIHVCDYEKYLRDVVREKQCFDLLFVDPPYRMLAEVEVMLTPLISSLLTTNGVAVVEGDRSFRVALGHTPVFDRTYGDTRVTMIRMQRSNR